MKLFDEEDSILSSILYWWNSRPGAWWYNFKYIVRNAKVLVPHIIKMRDFDYSYQLNLFCDSLEYLAKGLERYDHCLHSQRNYRRCLFAARRLRKAYDDEAYDDKSYKKLLRSNPFKFVKSENHNFSILTHDYAISKDYYDKMIRVIYKRQKNTAEARKQDAWNYLNKYIKTFWD